MTTENDNVKENDELEANEDVENDEIEDVDDATDDAEGADSTQTDDEPLGEGGKKALERERAERKRLERELKAAQRQNESEDERKLREAREEGAGEWKNRYVLAEAKSALTAAGVTKVSDKLLNLIDLDSIEIDEDGDVSGLDDQIDGLKEEFPSLFETKRRVPKGDAGDKQEANVPKSLGERLAQNMQKR